MADGFGMLEAQQQDAAQIPYKNIAVNQEGIAQALNAFRVGAEINIRKSQLQRQLEAMALHNQQQDFMNQYREQDFQRKLEYGQQLNELKRQAQEKKDAVTDLAIANKQKTLDEIGNMASGFGALNLRTLDPKELNSAHSAVWNIIAQNQRAAEKVPGLAAHAFSEYNTSANAIKNKLKNDYDTFLRDEVRPSIGRGQSTDTNLLYHPELWKAEWIDEKGQSREPPPEGAEWAKGWHPSGNLMTSVPNSDPTKGNVWINLPARKITDLTKKLQALDERARNLPPLESNEYVKPDTGIPQGSGQKLDSDTAMKILQQAGGDKVRARQMAIQQGYTL